MKRWPLHKAQFWETAPFFRLLLPLVAGIVLYPLWKGSLMVALFTMLFAYLLFTATAVFKTQNSVKRIVTFVSLHTFFIFLSFSLCYLNDVRTNKQWYGHTINTADFYKVRITETPVSKESSYKLRVDVLESILPDKTITATGKAFVYAYKGKKLPALYKGDTLLVANKWMPVKNSGNPFEFDYAAYCARNNIYHQQFIGAKDIPEQYKGNESDRTATEAAHDWCMQTLEKYVRNKQTLGLIQSMLIGDEVNLDNDTRQSFTDTGIVHIIAISGGNIAILFVLVMVLFSWLRHKKHLWIKYAVAVPLAWFYVLMAGASPSAVRAALMFTILALGFMLQKRRDANSLNQLFATAFILLVAEPMWLYAIGFQLSFIAVLSLILFYKHIYRIYTPVNKILKAVWGTIAASIAAEILVAPIVIYYFHTFPLMFIVSNVVAYVLMSCVLILGMSVIAFSFVPAMAKLIASVVTWIVDVFQQIISFLQKLEPPLLHTLRLNEIGLLLLYLLIASLAIYLLRRKLIALTCSVTSLVLLFISFAINNHHDKEQKRLVVYNVGKAHHIELISGKSYSVITTVDSLSDKIDYAVQPAHIGWQAMEKQQSPGTVLNLNGKTISILTDTLTTADARDVDYAIIAYRAKLKHLRMIDSLLHPEAIVLSYSMFGNQLSNWKALCEQAGIKVYTMQDGAFILED